MRAAESFATRPVTFRVGGLPDSSDELLDLLQHQVGDEWVSASPGVGAIRWGGETTVDRLRSEEHTSELQSRLHLVCRLLLEKKKKNIHKVDTASRRDYRYH